MQNDLTQERLKELIVYNPDTGSFTWRVPRRGVVVGGECGRISPATGYRDIGIDYKLRRANRLAWLYMTGEWPDAEVDHVNRIKSDDRWDNLRLASKSQNAANVDIKSSNTSGVVGVSWDMSRKKWLAQIRIDGKKKNLGRFDDIQAAVDAYNTAAREQFGEYANV